MTTKRKNKILKTFASLVKAAIKLHNETCPFGFELTLEEVCEKLLKEKKK